MEVKAELTFPGKLKDEAIICNLCKEFDIILNIVEASFSTDIGWAILVFKGKEEVLRSAFDSLKNKGVTIENIKEQI